MHDGGFVESSIVKTITVYYVGGKIVENRYKSQGICIRLFALSYPSFKICQIFTRKDIELYSFVLAF